MRHEASTLEHDAVLAFALHGLDLITLQHSFPEVLSVSVRQIGEKVLADHINRFVFDDTDLVGEVACLLLDLDDCLVHLAINCLYRISL